MEFVHCEFGHGICKGKRSSSWHVFNISSKYRFKPEQLRGLLGSAAGPFVVHVARTKYQHPRTRRVLYHYVVLAQRVMNRDKLADRMKEVEARVVDMETLHAPADWLEAEPCESS